MLVPALILRATDVLLLQVIDPLDIPSFPFQTSTILYPEWCLGALPHVNHQVAKAVAEALMQLNSTHYAAEAGTYSTWDPPLSYMPLREMQEKLHWIDMATSKCMRSSRLYEAIVCPKVLDLLCGGAVLGKNPHLFFCFAVEDSPSGQPPGTTDRQPPTPTNHQPPNHLPPPTATNRQQPKPPPSTNRQPPTLEGPMAMNQRASP